MIMGGSDLRCRGSKRAKQFATLLMHDRLETATDARTTLTSQLCACCRAHVGFHADVLLVCHRSHYTIDTKVVKIVRSVLITSNKWNTHNPSLNFPTKVACKWTSGDADDAYTSLLATRVILCPPYGWA